MDGEGRGPAGGRVGGARRGEPLETRGDVEDAVAEHPWTVEFLAGGESPLESARARSALARLLAVTDPSAARVEARRAVEELHFHRPLQVGEIGCSPASAAPWSPRRTRAWSRRRGGGTYPRPKRTRPPLAARKAGADRGQ